MEGVMKLHKGNVENLLSEQEAVAYLGLQDRPSPKGALRWLMRTRKVAYVKLARGIYGFHRRDLEAFVENNRVPEAPGR